MVNDRGIPCSENLVAELMRQYGIAAKAPRRSVRTTRSRTSAGVSSAKLGILSPALLSGREASGWAERRM